MGHDAAIKDLKAFTKVAAFDLPPTDFVAALKGESDRGAIILAATMIDDRLTIALRGLMPHINSDEASRIFGVDGLAGTFANRLKLAQALGVIDRGTRKLIELIREMRNASAHSRQVVTFSTPVIRAAIVSMMPAEDDDHEHPSRWPDHQARDIFCLLCGAICDSIGGSKGLKEMRSLKTMMDYIRTRVRASPLPGKHAAGSTIIHPPPNETD